VDAAEKVGERDAQDARLEVPQRDVDGRDGHRTDPRPARVAQGIAHGRPRGLRREHVASAHDAGQRALDDRRDRRVAVGVADTGVSTRPRLHDDDRRCVPLQRAVGLRLGRRDRVGARLQPLDDHQAI